MRNFKLSRKSTSLKKLFEKCYISHAVPKSETWILFHSLLSRTADLHLRVAIIATWFVQRDKKFQQTNFDSVNIFIVQELNESRRTIILNEHMFIFSKWNVIRLSYHLATSRAQSTCTQFVPASQYLVQHRQQCKIVNIARQWFKFSFLFKLMMSWLSCVNWCRFKRLLIAVHYKIKILSYEVSKAQQQFFRWNIQTCGSKNLHIHGVRIHISFSLNIFWKRSLYFYSCMSAWTSEKATEGDAERIAHYFIYVLFRTQHIRYHNLFLLFCSKVRKVDRLPTVT